MPTNPCLTWLRKISQFSLLPMRLQGVVVGASQLKCAQKNAMYGLYERYYEGICREQFDIDLANKSDVILLLDRKILDPDSAIKGFSTLTEFVVSSGKQKARILFSGDTVVDKMYWGQRTLGITFLVHLFKLKLKNPWQPLYWFLISKGYKTYLLMANNFRVHFPRLEKQNPEWAQDLLNAAGKHLYPKNYDVQSGIIRFSDHGARVRKGVAEIDEQTAKNPRVAFFVSRNPAYFEGDELACLAKMELSMPLRYYAKSVVKMAMKFAPRKHADQPKDQTTDRVMGADMKTVELP